MPTEMSKAYDAAAVQTEVAGVWEAEKLFHAEPTDPGEPYSIVIPPPNVTAALHLGHALNNTIQDILIRRARMEGKNAVWLPGTDHAGIATQTVVEKRVMKEEGRRRTDFGRDEFVGKIQAWKDQYEQVILGQLKAMGCSCDWDRTAFTMDEPRAKAVREAFFQLFKAGLIYRGKRLVNWDPATQTALADDEVENEEVDGFFYYLRYEVVDAAGNASPSPLAGEGGVGGSSVGESSEARNPSPHPAHRDGPQGEGEQIAYITVATTRPETMLGDTAVAVNPSDSRAAALKGKFIKLPIVGRIIPIIEDDYVVKSVAEGGDPADTKAQFASGFLKVTPAHDPNDWDIGLRHDLPVINVMAPDASISDQHGWTDVGEASFLLGLSREAAREAVVEWFRRHGLLEAVKPYRHSVGHSYRSHVPIEPYLSDQWYCRVTDDRLRGAALRAMSQRSDTNVPPTGPLAEATYESANSAPSDHSPQLLSQAAENCNSVTFYPARYAKTYQTWNENLRDWCISRQLWWGHRIPVFAFQLDVNSIGHANSADSYIEARQHLRRKTERALDDLANSAQIKDAFAYLFDEDSVVLRICARTDSAVELLRDLGEYAKSFHFEKISNAPLTFAEHRPDGSEIFSDSAIRLVAIGAIKLILWQGEDSDVLDTWFSSGLWPLSTLGWPDADAAPLAKWNPTSVLTTGREIITLWVSRMVMFNSFFNNGKVPFKEVYVHTVVQDGEGRKMSKTLGNGVDPLDIIASHGTDALRYTMASMCTQTQDVRMPVEKDPATGKNTSPKFDLGRNFANKVWNGARFVIGQIAALPPGTDTPSANQTGKVLTLADLWVLSKLNRTIDEANAALADYRFDQYAKVCYDFFWRDFCDWYVEAAKPQMKDPTRQASTARVLASVLDASLRLMHPMIPFVTEKIWWQLNEVAPERGVLGRIACPKAERCIKAQWPRRGELAESAEAIFGKIQEIVVAIRTLRSDYKVDAKKSVAVRIKAADDAAHPILSLKASIELLAVCTIGDVGEGVTASPGATAVQAGGCEVFVEGLVDPAAEALRVAKRRDELTKKIAAHKGRLGNAGYVAKAPPKLVKETQDELAAAEAELAALG